MYVKGGHVLHAAHAMTMNKRFVVFDTEDDSPEVTKRGGSGFNKRVTQIAAKTSDGKEFYNEGNIEQFLRWLRDMEPAAVWAHNLQYDLGNVFGDCLDEIDATTIGGRFIRCYWNGIEFRDSFNIWTCSVANLGVAFGLRKLETNVHSKRYVFRDVEIVMRALVFLQRMTEEYEIPRMPCTLGGFAVRIWKAIGGKNWNCDWPFCRSALFGGRVELFRKEVHGDLYWTDINSLYPHCMTYEYPVGANDMKDIEGFGIAGCKIKVPEDFIMPLPCRSEGPDGEDRVIYPYGMLKGIWTFHELRNAVEHGAKIQKIYDAVGSKRGHKFYAEFVERFYKLRKETKDEAKRLFYKLLMNNLYGQLASRGVITKTVALDDPRLRGGAKTFGTKAFLDLATAPPEHVNYMHAAYVTSYGRLELFRYLKSLGKRMIYTDTDSAIFEGTPPFQTGPELGQMKLEARGEYCRTHAPKTYVFDDDYVAKGVPKKYAKTFITKKKASYLQPFRYREAAQFFDRGNTHKLSVWRKVTKELRSKYDKKELRGNIYYPRAIDTFKKSE